MLSQYKPLAPVAGIGQAIVRTAAIHPLLALACIVICQRKVRTAVTESFAYRDAFRIERVGDGANRSLGAFLVNIPTFEMFDRAGIYHDHRWMDDGPGIHQRAR